MSCCFLPEDFPFLDQAMERICQQLRAMADAPCGRERIARAVIERAGGGERDIEAIVTSVLASMTSPERAVVVYRVKPTDTAWHWEVRTAAGDQVVDEGYERTSINARAAALEAAVRLRWQ